MRALPPKYFATSVLLLLLLVGLYTLIAARRTQEELLRQLEEKGLALAEALETSSRSAIRGNALMEEMIAQRLFDNARLVDQLLLSRAFEPGLLKEISEANRLRRIDLLDRDGRPYTPPPARMMRGMEGPRGMVPGPQSPEHRQEMMRYMWGRRWSGAGDEPAGEAGLPLPIREKRFWEGSLFGVALGARSFPGIIAVHADAEYVLNFRREIGVEREIEEMGRQAGVAEVALIGHDLTLIAHSGSGKIGQRDDDPFIERALSDEKRASRRVTREGREVFEVVRPIRLDAARLGILRIALSTAPMREALRRDLRSALLLSLAVLLVGALGMAVIFYTQERHMKEVKRLQADVERGERLSALGNLAAVVGHEVRNPLNAISMGLQRLRGEWKPGESAAEYARMVELMQGEVRRLNTIVEEFLSLARPLAVKPEPLKPGDLIGDVVALVEPDAESRGIGLSVKVPDDLPVASLDRDQLKQALLNLVTNAFDAMPGGGTLTIAAAAHRDSITLTVEDTGAGIPPDLLPKLFEPYVTTKVKGMGLGLPIARRIVEAHGGSIRVESAPGKGSCFTITLPLENLKSRISNFKDG